MERASLCSSRSVSPNSSISQVAGGNLGAAAPPAVEELLAAGFTLEQAQWMWEQYFTLCRCIVARSMGVESSTGTDVSEPEMHIDHDADLINGEVSTEGDLSSSGVRLSVCGQAPRCSKIPDPTAEQPSVGKPVQVRRSYASRRRRVGPPEGAYVFQGECKPGASGYEYAKLVRPESWEGVCKELGPYPGLRSLLSVGPQHLLPLSELSAIRVKPRARHVDLGSCVSATSDTTFFTTVLRSVPTNELSKKWRKVLGDQPRTYVPGVTMGEYGLGGERYCRFGP